MKNEIGQQVAELAAVKAQTAKAGTLFHQVNVSTVGGFLEGSSTQVRGF